MNKTENKHNLQSWYVEIDSQRLRRFGKTLEELGELQAVVARCIIQGIDEVDPSSQKTNRLRLEEEIADVYAQLFLLEERFNLDTEFIAERMMHKTDQMYEWDRLVEEDTHPLWTPSTEDSEWTYSGD